MAPRVPRAELTGLTGTFVKWFSRRMFGEVPEPLEVIWHHRRIVKDSLRLGARANKWNAVDQNLKSFAHLAASAQVGCSWCLDLAWFHAQNEHLDMAKAAEVPRWRESDVFTPLERDVLAYAEAMTTTPTTVTDELSARLLDRLGPEALVELTAFIAFSNFSTRNNTALGITSQGFSDTCEIPMPDRVRVASMP